MSGGYPLGWEICNGTDAGTNTGTSLGTTVTNSGTVGTYGAYTQLVASSAADACYLAVNIVASASFANSNNVSVKIAIGGAGSEVDIIKDLICFNGGGQPWMFFFVFPVSVPAGTRISAATVGSQNGADNLKVAVTLFDGTFTQIEGCAGVDSIGFTSGHGTSMSPGAANTKGSYAQLTASAPRDYLGFSFAFDAAGSSAIGNFPGLVDISIGGAGSEQLILPNFPYVPSGTSNPIAAQPGIYPIPIPAGTRVAARMQNSGGSGATGITLYGIYQ